MECLHKDGCAVDYWVWGWITKYGLMTDEEMYEYRYLFISLEVGVTMLEQCKSIHATAYDVIVVKRAADRMTCAWCDQDLTYSRLVFMYHSEYSD